ncbi:MAG: NlpC/P60 family protein, partial [Leucobacter sp.]
TVVALVTGALVLAPVTSAFATETEVEAPTTVVPESQDAQSQDSETEAPESAEDQEAAETATDEAPESAPAEQAPSTAAAAKSQEAPQTAGAAAAADAPVDVQIAGKAVVGEKLQASAVLQNSNGVTIDKANTTYTWKVDNTNVAEAASYKVKTADFDKEIEVVANVTLSASGALAAAKKTVSKKTSKVQKQKASVKAKVKVSGKALVGKTLKAKTKIVKKSKGVKVQKSYTWYANGKKVATGQRYKVKAKDRNKRIRAVANLTWSANSTFQAGSKQTKSSKTKKVKKQKAKVSAKLKLSGKAVVGKTLKARAIVKKPGDLRVKNTFTWYVDGKKVKTGKRFNVKSQHAGASIKVVYKAKWGSKKYIKGSKERVKTRNVPMPSLGPTITAGAKSQLGVGQDCTALVEKALRAAGIPAGDLGTMIHEYTGLGGKTVSGPQPGDVFIWQGRHVAIYIGNDMAVHGGFGGTTKIGSAYQDGTPSAIVRFA